MKILRTDYLRTRAKRVIPKIERNQVDFLKLVLRKRKPQLLEMQHSN